MPTSESTPDPQPAPVRADRIDAHVHVWDPGALDYGWLASVPPLRRPFLASDLHEHAGPAAPAGWLFVQADCASDQSVAEIEWLAHMAADDATLRGAVAHAPVEFGDEIRAILDALASIEHRGQPLVRGVRRLLQDERDPMFCLQENFVTGVRAVGERDWAFDLCIRSWQLPNVTELVRQCPQVSFVLDHLGKPPIAKRELDPWRTDLRQLGQLPNVAAKLSGLVTEANHASWTPAQLRPFVEHALEVFGPHRLMFGSDWPVATLACEYPRWCSTLDALLLELMGESSESGLAAIHRDTASRIYRL